MSSDRRLLAPAVCLLLAACGCARRAQPRYDRLAVLQFENLTGDPALDWQARAISAAAASQLTGAPGLKLLGAQQVRELPESGATLSLAGYIAVERGNLVARAVLERAGRTVKGFEVSAPVASGPLPVADAVARAVDAHAGPFGTANRDAVHAYADAIAPGAPPEATAAAFERAVAADTGFGEAYLAWCQWLLARGDRAGAQRVLVAASGHRGRFGQVPGAQLAVVAEMLNGAYPARRQALVSLARATPADATVFARLGALDVAARQFPQGVEAYRQALAREPANPVFLNELGYAQAFAGDLAGAVKTLTEYRAASPEDPNALDSLGDVNFMHGRFADAERFYLEANAKNPAFSGGGELEKAARARLMSGDKAGAEALFGRYLEARRAMRDPALEYRQAEWEILSGKRPEAVARMERIASSPSPGAWLALVQLSALSLDSGDRDAARRFAGRALAAPGGKQQALAALAVFATAPSAPPAEWTARAEKTFAAPGLAALKSNALAFALLFDGHPREAVPLFDTWYRESQPASPEPVGVYLGWALVAAGSAGQAQSPLSFFPLPRPNTGQPFAAIALPRVRELRMKAGFK